MTVSTKKKVYVGLSGGVDSSVSAALLKEQGYDVRGVFIKVWQPDFYPCTATEDRLDAMRVCAALDIPFETLDLEEEYKKGVVEYMLTEYKAGRTPNPDVMCNKEVKFGAFLKYAGTQGADFVATGHYAQIKEGEDGYGLYAGSDGTKDQSYFLWTLPKAELPRILFPVGGIEKSHVRKLAQRFGLPTATKKDSQGLCFLGKLDMKEFLGHFIAKRKGAVVDESGKIIGEHEGAIFYVLGERHGFTLHGGPAEPHYVVAKDIEANTITVSTKHHVRDFITGEVKLTNTNWIGKVPDVGAVYLARSRYRQSLAQATVAAVSEGVATLTFEDPPLSPQGQSMVIYEEDQGGLRCVGGGVIA